MSTDNWMTLASALIGGTLVGTGWFVTGYMNQRKDVALKRLEYRLQALQSFLPVLFAFEEASHSGEFPSDTGQRLKTARSTFQLYGTTQEIELMEKFISAVEISAGQSARKPKDDAAVNKSLAEVKKSLDDLVLAVRVGIRTELGLD